MNCPIFTMHAKTCAALLELIPLPAYNQFDVIATNKAVCTWLYAAWENGLLNFAEYNELREIVETWANMEYQSSKPRPSVSR